MNASLNLWRLLSDILSGIGHFCFPILCSSVLFALACLASSFSCSPFSGRPSSESPCLILKSLACSPIYEGALSFKLWGQSSIVVPAPITGWGGCKINHLGWRIYPPSWSLILCTPSLPPSDTWSLFLLLNSLLLVLTESSCGSQTIK